MATVAAPAAWTKIVTNCTDFLVQNTGLRLVRVSLVATAGAAPTGDVGFKLEPNEAFSRTVAGHDVYVRGVNGIGEVEYDFTAA